MALFAACHGIESRTGFLDDVYPLLQEVLPHERFVCGIATVAPVALLDVVNAGFPAAFVTDVVDRRGRIASPVIRRWLIDFRQHGMRNLIAHGIKDLHGGATSYFCFAGVPDGGVERRRMLQLVVLDLHAALRAHYRLMNRARDVELSCREREVLQLVCVGKSNGGSAASSASAPGP